MRKIYFLLMALLLAVASWSQTTTWTGAVNTAWDNAGNWTNGVPAANYIVIFPAGTTGTITRVAQSGSITLNGLEIQGDASVRFAVQGGAKTITIANGPNFNDFAIAAPASLTLAANITLVLASGSGGNPTAAGIDGDFILESGSTTYDTDNLNVLTNVDGQVRNGGTILGAAGRLSFNGGSLYVHTRNGGTIPTATWNATSTASIEGIINSTPTGFGQTFGNFTWNSPAQSINFSFDGLLVTINGDFTVNSTGTGRIILKNFGSGTTTTTVAGDYTQTGGTVYIIGTSESQTLSIKGDFNMSGGTLTRGGTPGATSIATVIFSGTTEQAFNKTAGTISGEINFTVNNNAIVNFDTHVLSGSTGTFTLSSGAKIITANDDGLGPTGSVQMTTAFNSNADYEFRGAHTGVFTTTPSNTVRDLIINNPDVDGEVILDRPLTVNRNFILTAGLLTTSSTNLLTLGTAATASAPSATSFVNGPMAKTGNTAFTFPVGKAGEGFRTIGITAPTGIATFRAEFFRSNPANGTLTGGLTQISNCEFWDLTKTGGGAVTAKVILSWEPQSPCGSSPVYVTNPLTLVVAHLVGGNWVNEGRSASTGDATAGTVTSLNNVATFSPFTLGSISSLDNPLPVLFANVKAYEKNGGVQIEWSNMTEKDVAGYTVERSGNGQDFSSVSQHTPTSNQNDRVDYSAFDPNPSQGNNYYRIKAQETTGKIVYSKILNVSVGSTTEGLRLYPNPVRGNQITLSMSNIKRGKYTLRVISSSGQDIFQQVINNQSSNLTQTLDLPATIKAGVYSLVINGDGYRQTKTFVVQ